MEDIYIKATEKTPEVNIKVDEGYVKIEGRSLPENVRSFYYPLVQDFNKIIEYWKKESELEDFEFHVKLGYFNSSSAKFILDLLMAFMTIETEAYKQTKVYWYYEEEDIDMKEAGMQMADLLNKEFEYIEYTDE